MNNQEFINNVREVVNVALYAAPAMVKRVK